MIVRDFKQTHAKLKQIAAMLRKGQEVDIEGYELLNCLKSDFESSGYFAIVHDAEAYGGNACYQMDATDSNLVARKRKESET